MKKTTLLLLTGLAIATSAQAGEDYSAKASPVVVAPPCLWTWFAGGSVGQVSGDWDEEIYTLHVGAELKCPDAACSHAIYLEVGYTEKDESFMYYDPKQSHSGPARRGHESLEIIPITLNYKYECSLTGQLNWYAGAGAGIALVDYEYSGALGKFSDDDSTFYAHVFTGLVYNVSQSFEIFTGARFIFMDDVFGGLESPLDEELHYELGARFNF